MIIIMVVDAVDTVDTVVDTVVDTMTTVVDAVVTTGMGAIVIMDADFFIWFRAGKNEINKCLNDLHLK